MCFHKFRFAQGFFLFFIIKITGKCFREDNVVIFMMKYENISTLFQGNKVQILLASCTTVTVEVEGHVSSENDLLVLKHIF